MVGFDRTQIREGGDITAADMVLPDEPNSQIVEFFTGSTIFLTGATGFIGKLVMEKLLRTCPDLSRIYIMIRPKKGKDIQKRYEEIFDGPNFDPLKRKYPNFYEKIQIIPGDCSLENLDLSKEHYDILINEVDCIIHCAATVRFDEKLRNATNINVRSLRDLIKLAKKIKTLRAMIYVSTAFSNCPNTTIDEAFYDPPMIGDKLLALLDTLDDDKLNAITPTLLGNFPNTYVFTKCIAENIIKQECQQLPVAVFRPAIVIATVKEPVAGWIDNLYGATGVLVGAALGLLRSLHGNADNIAEMVPADFVVNSILAACWDVASIKSINDNKEHKDLHTIRERHFEREIPIYNFVSSPEKQITWRSFIQLAQKHAPQVPSHLIVWHYFFAVRSNLYLHKLAVFFYHKVPAYLIDFLAFLIGKKPMLVKGYQKIDKFGNVLSYFVNRQWKFKNNNVQTLWKQMNKQDRQLFEFSMIDFNWDAYFYTYVRGARAYLLKDPLETVPQGRIKYYKVMVAHYVVVTLVFLFIYKILSIIFNFLF